MKFDFASYIIKNAKRMELPLVCTCEQGKIHVQFDTDGIALKTVLGQNTLSEVIRAQGPEVFLRISSAVRIIVEWSSGTEGQISARFEPAECYAIFNGKWPDSDSFSRVERAVRGEKLSPTPEPEIPGGGDKSRTAQGQTKKEGSHSHDRHG